MAESVVLEPEECLRLLRSGVFGRVALTAPTGPQIVPVNYSVVGDRVVFRTSAHSTLAEHCHHARLVFEVDHVDYEYWTGWSVMAHGRGELISDATDLETITGCWSPRPWAAGRRNVYVGLRWAELTGRRLGPLDLRRDLPVDRVVPTSW